MIIEIERMDASWRDEPRERFGVDLAFGMCNGFGEVDTDWYDIDEARYIAHQILKTADEAEERNKNEGR